MAPVSSLRSRNRKRCGDSSGPHSTGHLCHFHATGAIGLKAVASTVPSSRSLLPPQNRHSMTLTSPHLCVSERSSRSSLAPPANRRLPLIDKVLPLHQKGHKQSAARCRPIPTALRPGLGLFTRPTGSTKAAPAASSQRSPNRKATRLRCQKNVAAMAKHTYGEALLLSSKTHKPPAAPVRTAGNSAQRLKHVCFHN